MKVLVHLAKIGKNRRDGKPTRTKYIRATRVQSDSQSGDEIEIKLNNEKTIDKQEEIKLSRQPTPVKQFTPVRQHRRNLGEPTNLNEEIRMSPLINLRSYGSAIGDQMRRPPVDSNRDNTRVPEHAKIETQYDRKDCKPDMKKDDQKETKPDDKNDDKPDLKKDNRETQLDGKKDGKSDLKKDDQKEKTDKPSTKATRKVIEKIPINWLTIVGDKKLYKENIGLFERGDKVNIFRLKPPNFHDFVNK